ncbi:MAG: amidohydrolase [Gammaproteobacteria bacterium RIFCSPLOWO2_02_FULL_61_13]|nr:MAG: amidohydrolase [Gammaproteobacteria bacterium RIFCSPLOWO2_02_FULL_61_13]
MQGKIALEEHFAPPADWDNRLKYVSARLPNWPEFARRQEQTFDLGLKEMDENGVEHTIVSLGAPGIQAILDPKDALEVAQRSNDLIKKNCERRPGRFSAFAAVPMQDPELAARELERCVKDLGFKGCMVNGFTQLKDADSAIYCDLPRYDPVWEMHVKLDVPFYLHPRNPPASQLRIFEGHPWLLGSTWAFGVETATHALRMMGSGMFDRHPKLQVIIGHLGESLPSSIWRVDHRIKKGGEVTHSKKPLAEYFRNNFHLTTSGNFHDSTLTQAITEVGVDRIMFSADYPFEDFGQAAQWFDKTPMLNDADRMKIGRTNAQKLFKMT